MADLFGLMSDSSALEACHGLLAKLDRDGALRKAAEAIAIEMSPIKTP